MAKIIKYKFLSTEVNHGTEEAPDIQKMFLNVSMPWNEANEEIAKREAYNGEYTIEDDGVEETPTPTLENRVESLETETSDLSEALELLLSGVTE